MICKFRSFLGSKRKQSEKKGRKWRKPCWLPRSFWKDWSPYQLSMMWSKSRSCIWRQLWLNVWHLARNLQLQSCRFQILTYGQSQICNISSWLSLRKRPTRSILRGRIKILWTCHIISHLRGKTSCRLRVSQKNVCRHWASSVPSWDCVVRQVLGGRIKHRAYKKTLC